MFTLNIYLDYYTILHVMQLVKFQIKTIAHIAISIFNKDEYMKHIELCNKVAECGTQIKMPNPGDTINYKKRSQKKNSET